LTTRHPRQGEDLGRIDLDHVERDTFNAIQPDFTYEYGGELYGIQRSRLNDALKQYQSVFVIVRNVEIIAQLKREYRRFCPTSAFIYVDSRVVNRRATELRSPAVRDSVHQAFLDYMRSPESYDEVIVNASSANDFYRLLNILIQRGMARPSYRYQVSDNQEKLVVATSVTTRRVLQFFAAVLFSIGVAFTINLVTAGNLDYWRRIALIVTAILLVFTAFIEMVLLSRWRELE
jgi:guanylate kinase